MPNTLADQQASFVRNTKPVPMERMPGGVRVLNDVAYGPTGFQKIDVYMPRASAPTPVLIEFHGGGWRNGDKSQLGIYKGIIEDALEAGIAVAAANYRLTPEHPWPAQGEDTARIVQFTRAHAKEWNIDPKKVALIGGSAGAHLSMWIALLPDQAKPASSDPVERESTRVSAVLDCWGPLDLTRMSLDGRMELIGCQMFACQPEEWDSPRIMAQRKEASPLLMDFSAAPPVLIIHDHTELPMPADPNWKIADGHSSIWGKALIAAMERAGRPVEALFGATPETWRPEARRFLAQRLLRG